MPSVNSRMPSNELVELAAQSYQVREIRQQVSTKTHARTVGHNVWVPVECCKRDEEPNGDVHVVRQPFTIFGTNGVEPGPELVDVVAVNRKYNGAC